MIRRCSDFHASPPVIPLSVVRNAYCAGIDDAKARMKAGDTQIRCPICGHLVWRSLFHRVPVQILEHLGGNHYRIVGYEGDPP